MEAWRNVWHGGGGAFLAMVVVGEWVRSHFVGIGFSDGVWYDVGMDYADKLTDKERGIYETALKCRRRRELFVRVFTPEVLDELEDFLGVKDVLFAFQSEGAGGTDPYKAARIDALLGVMRALRFEVTQLDAANEMVRKMEEEIQARS